MDADLLAPLGALVQVLLIDLTLAADNAVIVALAVAGLPAHQKRPAIIAGIAAATLMRIGLGAITLQLLEIVGLLLAGGLLLLWVCWKMYRELRAGKSAHAVIAEPKTLRQAMVQIMVADLSMSLDNVLAVAGAAAGHPWVMAVGIGLSVVLMGVAAQFVAGLLERWRWIAWVGLLIVFYVALKLIWDGGHEVLAHLAVK